MQRLGGRSRRRLPREARRPREPGRRRAPRAGPRRPPDLRERRGDRLDVLRGRPGRRRPRPPRVARTRWTSAPARRRRTLRAPGTRTPRTATGTRARWRPTAACPSPVAHVARADDPAPRARRQRAIAAPDARPPAGSHRTGPPAITKRRRASLMRRPGPASRDSSAARSRRRTAHRGPRCRTGAARRRSPRASGSERRASTPAAPRAGVPIDGICRAQVRRADSDGTMTRAARSSQPSKRRRHRASMCGAVSGKCRNARSCTTSTTPARAVAGGRKFVASSSRSRRTIRRAGRPARHDSGWKTRAGNREAFSVRLGADVARRTARAQEPLRVQVPRDVVVIGVGRRADGG